MSNVFIPRRHGKPLEGYLFDDPALPHHEVHYFRALLYQQPNDSERARIRAQADEADPKRHVLLEISVHRDAAC